MAIPEERTLEDVTLPDAVEGFSKQRVELVQRAVKQWTHALIDLGGRNNLLRYRDLTQGTLDLTKANPAALRVLLQSKAIKLSALFTDPEERQRNLRRTRTIHNKANENFEERGLETLSLACGLATWENKRASWEPSAPVLLRQATIRPLGAAQDEFELALVDEMEVNPTLLHLLKVDFDCDVNPEMLLDRVDGAIDEAWELDETYAWLGEQARRVPGFAVVPRLVLANFAYAKLPMVRDLENAFDELVAHDLIAAISGDEAAKEAIRAAGPGPEAIPAVDSIALADEFLVLDADSSQNYAINAVLVGESLIVKGPPGTGKSQTIANLIGSLVARNKRVLFVAEKRAAIDAVLKRLDQQKLGDLVLDLHGGIGSRRAFAQAIGQALVASRTVAKIDNSTELKKVEKRREVLNDHVAALHEPRSPWGVTVYELRAELLGLEDARNDVRLRDHILAGLSADVMAELEEELAEYARLGGMTLAAGRSPWARSPIVSDEEVQQAHGAIDELRRHTLPTTVSALRLAGEQTGLPSAENIAGWEPRLALWADVEEMLGWWQPSLYGLPLDDLCGSLAPAGEGGFSRLKASMFSGDYKSARETVRAARREAAKEPDSALLEACQRARQQLARWQQLGGVGVPSAPAERETLEQSFKLLLAGIGRLEGWAAVTGLPGRSDAELDALAGELVADRATLMLLPELHRLQRSLLAAGLGELLAELRARQVSDQFAVRSLRFTWLQSILDSVSITDRRVGGFVPDKHTKTVDDYKLGDRKHIETSAARIRRLAAEQAVRVRDANRQQEDLVQDQARRKTRHMPVRDLIGNASDVLLALKPCWAMSPLVVSQLLPPETYFDVVVFDEASQITPADAISSILRGRQLVIAGDEKQLPPTSFFVSENPEEEEEESDPESTPVPLVAGTTGFESILDALGVLLRFRMLQWHYRSRDERLIAFSNAHIYDRQLVTFPGASSGDVLAYHEAPWDPAADTNSPTPEVDAVVALILEHARERPKESLGVIAMGVKHANRIEECLRRRLHDDPELETELGEFFAEDREERFFVKNLERVQGDERDAIILSFGYGKDAKGGVPLRWGPILEEGGERRLNVAVSRAKNRVTVVSSFGVRDLDPERSTRQGYQFVRQYLQFVESGGTNLGDRVVEKPALNPFEVDVRDTLQRRGLKVTAQYGTSGYWIDYAVQHPTQPGRYVLAIECDGATYHSSESARDRDRLRQEQLERLGWRFCRIWSSEWFHDKERCVEKVMEAYRVAVEDADRRDAEGAATGNEAPVPPASPAEAEARASRVGTRPSVPRGKSITDYSQAQLVLLARWIESDDYLRTEDELLEEMMRELGFQRRGPRIVASIKLAIGHARLG